MIVLFFPIASPKEAPILAQNSGCISTLEIPVMRASEKSSRCHLSSWTSELARIAPSSTTLLGQSLIFAWRIALLPIVQLLLIKIFSKIVADCCISTSEQITSSVSCAKSPMVTLSQRVVLVSFAPLPIEQLFPITQSVSSA